MDKNKQDKLTELKIPEDKWELFSAASIDVIYEQFSHMYIKQDTKYKQLLFFLNEILKDSGLEEIDVVEHFKIDRSLILKLNGETFVKKHKKKLEECGIHLGNDLYYLHRNNNKSYGLTVLKGICKFYGYDIKSKIKSKYIENERIDTRYYKIEEV